MSVPTIATANAGSGTGATGATTVGVTTTAVAAAGTRLIAFVTWVSATGTLSGMTNPGGLSWTIDAVAGPASDNKRLAIMSAYAPSGLASATALQAGFSASSTSRSLSISIFNNARAGSTSHVQSVAALNTISGGTAWTTNAMTFTRDGLALALAFNSTGTVRTSVVVSPSLELFDITPGTLNDAVAEYRTGSSGTATVAGTWSGAVTETLVLGMILEGSFQHATPLADSLLLADLAIPDLEEGGADHAVPLGESILLGDSFARTASYQRTPADGLVLVDQTTDAQGIRLGDTFDLADELGRAVVQARQVDDTVPLADSVQPSTAGVRQVAAADTVVVSDELVPDLFRPTSAAEVAQIRWPRTYAVPKVAVHGSTAPPSVTVTAD